MRLRRAFSAGLFDVGSSALAHFAIGIYAARLLEDGALGIYALVFSAFLLATAVPAQLIFIPGEVVVLDHPPQRRLWLLPQTLRLGLLPSVASATIIVGAGGVALLNGPQRIVVPMVLTAIMAIFFSPTQDHTRRLFHFAERSWHAAAVSVVQVAVTIGALVALELSAVPRPWVPFGALALANVASLGTGLVMAARLRTGRPLPPLHPRDLGRSGRWLLVAALAPFGALFAGNAVLSQLAGLVALGHAEAARIVAQPVLVITVGLAAALRPESMAAAKSRDRAAARRVSRAFLIPVVVFAGAYAAVVSFDIAVNPLAAILPKAYVVSGLVALYVLANVAGGVLIPFRSELVGGGAETLFAGYEVSANSLRMLVIVVLAAGSGAYSLPLGLVVAHALSAVLYARGLGKIYADTQSPG